MEAKEVAEVIVWSVGVVGGVIAAWKAVAELRRANRERHDELTERRRQFRWRQAEMARSVLDQLWADQQARCAMKMLDWSGLAYPRDSGKTGPITHRKVETALRTTDLQFDEDEQFVRDCFDQFFDGLERIEHYLCIGLIAWDDVRGRLEYYVALLAERKRVMSGFLREYKFHLAAALLDRFTTWTAAPTQAA